MGRTKGGMNTKLHAVPPPFHGLHADHCRAVDAIGRPIQFSLTAGQVSDHIGVRALVNSLPVDDWLLGLSHRNYVSIAGQLIADMTRIGSARPL